MKSPTGVKRQARGENYDEANFDSCLRSIGRLRAGAIALKDMGSFHVGGREMTVSGKPVKEVTFAPGGVPAKVDPNGVYQVEQTYVQYFIPQNSAAGCRC